MQKGTATEYCYFPSEEQWLYKLLSFRMHYTFYSTNIVAIVTIDHETIGVDTLFVILSCIVFEILTKIGFSKAGKKRNERVKVSSDS